MKRVLFVFSIYNYFREMLPVAEYYAGKGWQVHALLGWTGATAREAAEFCRLAGWAVHQIPDRFKYLSQDEDLPPEQNALKAPNCHSTTSGWEKRFYGLKKILPAARGKRLLALEFTKLLVKGYFLNNWTKNFLSGVAPHLVFAGPFHSAMRFDNSIARVCAAEKIPYCSLTVSVYVGKVTAMAGRYNNVHNGMLSPALGADYNLTNKIIARIFPHWIQQVKGKRFFPFLPEEMLAGRILGLLEPDPWQKPSERFDLVFVEAELSRELLVKSHYQLMSKVVVAGKPLLDRVYSNLNNAGYVDALYRDLGLSPGEPFILVNVEPSAEHHYASWEVHWRRFFSVMDCLAATGRPVILSLHPLCNPQDYKFVEEKYGFKISEKYRIVELYPFCSLAVSFPCSTNAFAGLFHKSLIIYDFVGMTKESYVGYEMHRIPEAACAYETAELGHLLAEFVRSSRFEGGPLKSVAAPRLACDIIHERVSQRFGL